MALVLYSRPGPWRCSCSRRMPTSSTKKRGRKGFSSAMASVKAIEPGTGALTLDHSAIKGCMPAMVMMYRVARPALSRNFRPGDAIDFTIEGFKYVILEATLVSRPR